LYNSAQRREGGGEKEGRDKVSAEGRIIVGGRHKVGSSLCVLKVRVELEIPPFQGVVLLVRRRGNADIVWDHADEKVTKIEIVKESRITSNDPLEETWTWLLILGEHRRESLIDRSHTI